MKKKLFLLIIAITVLLSACGSKEANSNSTEKEYVDEGSIASVYSDTDSYVGKYIKVTGQVFGSPESDEDGIYFQMYADPENYNLNTVVQFKSTDLSLADGDYVVVDGRIVDTYKGENMMGGSISAVAIDALSVEKSSYINVVSPTLKEMAYGQSQTQHGFSITVDKVEFAEKETRVYVTAANNSKDTVNLYSFNSKIVQNGQQYDEESNYNANYTEVQSEILSGVTSSGILTFPAIDSNSQYTLYIETYSNDYSVEMKDFEFTLN